MLRRTLYAITLLAALAPGASADDLVWTTGRVFGKDGRTPVSGAIVAVYNEKNRVIDYTRTDEDGRYTLAVPKSDFHLGPKGDGGFFHTVSSAVGGVSRIITYPLRYGIGVGVGAASAAGPITRLGAGAVGGFAIGALDRMTPNRPRQITLERDQPGVLTMKVTEPGHKDAVSLARVYWMEQELFESKGKAKRGLAAWVDPVNLTDPDDEKPSTITSKYLTFTEARFEPSIAEPGDTVTLVVKFPSPPDPQTPVVMIARNAKTGKEYELVNDGGDIYRAEVEVDKKMPRDDQVFVVVAYAEQDERPGRNKKVEEAIDHAGLLNPRKPYVYNPLLVVSRNRAEVALTVVQPAKHRRR